MSTTYKTPSFTVDYRTKLVNTYTDFSSNSASFVCKSSASIDTITTITTTYNILTTDQTIVCNNVSAFTIYMPNYVAGQMYRIKNISTGIITVSANAIDTIDGETYQELGQWDCMEVQCYAANKWIVI